MSGAPHNTLTVWSRLVAASLVNAGIRDVVVSPGSRSTPFVLALRARSELRLTSVIDERSAGFVALGIGRASGAPAAVLATSGTAPAHWLPAVIEASMTHVPLVLLSANRPLALAHAGAAQTIDQTKLFGEWARLFVDLGDPSAEPSALESIPRRIAQAVATSRGASPGPVHIDLHADKPLEPVEPSTDAERALATLGAGIERAGITTITRGSQSGDGAFAEKLLEALRDARRPMLLAGPRAHVDDADVIQRAAAALDLVVAAEAPSQLRYGPNRSRALDAYEVVFSSARLARDHAPDLVLQIGSLPTAPTLERVFRSVPRFVLDAGGIHDPLGGAIAISTASASATLALAGARNAPSVRDRTWHSTLAEAEAIAWREVERSIAAGRGEGAVVRAAVDASGGATLVIGNSLPIRTLDRFVPGGGPMRHVISQRGANGIDGLVSGAIGVALAKCSAVLAIVGDVSFVHDVGALAALGTLDTPLVIVVVDNGGGRIFEALPIAQTREAMPLFTTPHGIDLTAVTRAFGIRCVETRDAGETARAVADARARPHATVVRAIVEPHDASPAFDALVRAFDARFSGGAA